MKYFFHKIKFNSHLFFSLIIISLLLIQQNKSLYLNSAIKSINKFLYYSRMEIFEEQNKYNKCSLNQGPDCYFSDKKYASNFIIENEENSEINLINKQWVEILKKIQKNNIEKLKNNINYLTSNYISKYSKEIDEEQNPKNQILNLLLTFDSFDVDTIKGDIYLEERMGKIIYNEQIIADIKGKLLLKYDKDISEKDLKNKYQDYPSTTYGVIESDFITISFKGKLFSVNFFYIKGHDEYSKYEPINFYGYLNDQMVYSYTYTDNKKRNEKWLKVGFPDNIIVDKLIVSGMYDIDNISFNFPSVINVDVNEIYNMYNYKNIKILVSNDDI